MHPSGCYRKINKVWSHPIRICLALTTVRMYIIESFNKKILTDFSPAHYVWTYETKVEEKISKHTNSVVR